MAGRDLLGIAQTGTGKTAAFALPILHRLAADRKPAPRRALPRAGAVADPRTGHPDRRELQAPTASTWASRVAVIFGGVKYGPQINAPLAPGVDVLVATPGRLLDHMQREDARPVGAPRSSCSTRPTRCWTSASSSRSARSSPHAQPAPEPVLLGHHADRDRQAGRRTAERPGQGLGHARRPPRSSASTSRSSSSKPAASAPCWPSCSPTRTARAPWSSPAPSAAPTRSRPIWKPAASTPPPSTATRARASVNARWPPSRPASVRALVATDIAARGIDVDGVTPRGQLRAALRAGSLCPPHRPHRARRRRGHRHQLRGRRRAQPAEGHREAHPPEHPQRRPPQRQGAGRHRRGHHGRQPGPQGQDARPSRRRASRPRAAPRARRGRAAASAVAGGSSATGCITRTARTGPRPANAATSASARSPNAPTPVAPTTTR